MINFASGQLFDWFVSGTKAFALIERLPSNVTGNGNVGLDKAYTQVIKETSVLPGQSHLVAIRYTRGPGVSRVECLLDEQLTGIYPWYGPGKSLGSQLGSFVIGHGLFSLLDAFPFQRPDRTDLSVSIPLSEREFGQGATGVFSSFQVTQTANK